MHDLDKSRLERVANDPASTEEEKAIAKAALGTLSDPIPLHEQAAWMLQQLGTERIEDLTESEYERYCVAHFVKHHDPIVREFRFWVSPSFLDRIGLRPRDYWTAMHDAAKAANRPDAQEYARRKLYELEVQ